MAELQKEKKVEFLELVYDLIFVYIVGRNNALMHHVNNGFVTSGMFLAYVVCALAVIQIWNFTTFYINIYGRNSVRDHVFMFINMYLLYYIADGISVGWESTFYRFAIAWALILVNIAVQHLIELRNHKDSSWERLQLRRKAFIILGEAALIGVHILVYTFWGVSIAIVPILFGIVATILSGRLNSKVPIDFAHLSAWARPGDLPSAEQNLSVGRLIDTGHTVKGCCLSSTIGTDKRNNFTTVDFHAQIVDGDHTAKLHGQMLNTKNVVFHYLIPSFVFLRNRSGSSLVPMMPRRKKSTTIMIISEKITSRKPFRSRGTSKVPIICFSSRNLSHHSEQATNRKEEKTEPVTEPTPPITTIRRIS